MNAALDLLTGAAALLTGLACLIAFEWLRRTSK